MLLPPPENQDSLHHAWPSLVDLAAKGQMAVLGGGAPPDCPLWSLYAPVAEGRGEPAFVIGQLGQSLDGRVATATGKSRYINGPEAIRHLHRLRALVDAVVVGVGTVIADDPQLSVREVEGPCPARVVIDPNFRMPDCARMLGDGAGPIFAIQTRAGARAEGVEPIVVPSGADGIAPGAIVAALAARTRGPSAFVDDLIPNLDSAAEAAPAVHRFQLVADPRLAAVAPSAPDRHLRIDDWPRLRLAIARVLGADL